MHQVEVMEERERPQRFRREPQESDRTFRRYRVEDVLPLDVLEREVGDPGRRFAELEDLDEARMLEARERRELSPERLGVLRHARALPRELLPREGYAGSKSVLDEPNSAGAAFSEKPKGAVPVLDAVRSRHGRIIRGDSRKLVRCLVRETPVPAGVGTLTSRSRERS
jgi:hypothetical protein